MKKLSSTVAVCMMLIFMFSVFSYAEDLTEPIEAMISIDSIALEGPGYSSPEEAFTAFVDGLKAQDLRQMESAFAIETLAENIDAQAYVQRYFSLMDSSAWLPNTSEMNVEINTAKRISDVLTSIRRMYLMLTGSPFVEESFFTYSPKQQEIDEFMGEMFPNDGTEWYLNFTGELYDLSELVDDYEDKEERFSDILRKTQKIYRAYEISPLAGIITLNEKDFLLCMDTVRYGSKWYVLELGGQIGIILGTTQKSGGLIELTDDAYIDFFLRIF